MNANIGKELFNIGIQLSVAGLVWRYYKDKRCALSQKYSTFGPRLWAPSIDACVVWPIDFVATALFALNIPVFWAVLVLVFQTIAWLAYTVVMHAKFGQTIGKKMCRVKVVDSRTERAISFRQALIREGIPIILSTGLLGYEIFNIIIRKQTGTSVDDLVNSSDATWFLFMVPFFWFGAEVVTMLTNEKRRALHDYLAGTVVVRTNIAESSQR